MMGNNKFGKYNAELSLEEMIRLANKVDFWLDADYFNPDDGWDATIYSYTTYSGNANKDLKVEITECRGTFSNLGNYRSWTENYKLSVYSNGMELGNYKGKDDRLSSLYSKAHKFYCKHKEEIMQKKELDKKRKERNALLEQQKREKEKQYGLEYARSLIK